MLRLLVSSVIYICLVVHIFGRSQWPRGLRRGSVAALLRRGHGCLSVVSVVCCQVEVSATG